MIRSLLLLGAAGLLAAGCSGEDPLASGGLDPAAGSASAAKLTVSGHRAGGKREPGGSGPRHPGPEAPVRLERLHFDESLISYGLELTWLEVRDSRCAQGVTCVWEGEVGVLLGVKEGGKDLGTFALTLHDAEDERAKVKIGNRQIQLIEVAPYPVAEVETPRAEYVASLAVSLELVMPHPDNGLTTTTSTAGGCPEQPAMILAENRKKWEAAGISDYQFRFRRSCFCVPEFRREVTLRVRGGVIQAAQYTDNGEEVEAEYLDRYLTIEELFAISEGAIAQKAARVEISYDEKWGYPTRVYIDRSLSMADEEQEYQAEEVVALK